jgi:transcriptional regulator GlxA family with amidase domain
MRVPVISGWREERVGSGASMAWHDLSLHLVAHFAGATAAQEACAPTATARRGGSTAR